MASSGQMGKSAFHQESSACYSSGTSCSTFRPSSSSCAPSLPASDPRGPSAVSSLQQSSSARVTNSTLHYATAYPTPVEAYMPSSKPGKSVSLLTPESLNLPSGNHRPKSLPPGRNLRISGGGAMKLHHQSVRHVSANGSSGISSSTPAAAAACLSCPSPPSSSVSRHYLVGKMVVASSLRSPPPSAVPSSGSSTPAATAASSPVAAQNPVAATTCTSLHPPVVILHSKPYGLFGPLPKGLLREGHKQRIAGVDVLKLPDSTIIPRIENSSLQQMLQADPSIFTTLEAALTECVIFLYDEGIKPFAGEIAHQMRKRIEGGSWLPSEVVALAVAAKDVYPRVERRVKGEDGWVVLLKKELHPPNFDGFVDTRAREDCYSPEQWREFNRYFIEKMRVSPPENGSSPAATASAAQFTEGRYALAERLRAEIPMFRSMKLAHLIRMVQLASWKKLLTYRDKALVPVAACPVTAKEFAQRNCMNLRGSDKSAAALASIEQLLRALSCIVDPEPTGIFLAQLKDLVRWTTYERLDCMVLGHTKLQDLLMSEPFIRFYRLYTPEGNEHCTYVQSKKFPLPWGAVLHTKCSMLWDPDACPMGPSNEQQHFSLSDAGCCWQYKALIPLYAQQRNSVDVATCASSSESKGGESTNSRAATASEGKNSPPLLNRVKNPHGSSSDEGNACSRSTSALDEKAGVKTQLRTARGNICASRGAAGSSTEDGGKSEEGDAEDEADAVFHWVEPDILKLLDDDGSRKSLTTEPEAMFHSLENEAGFTRELPAGDFSITPTSETGLQRVQNSLPEKYQKDVLMERVHALAHASPHGSTSVAAEAPSTPWHASVFIEVCSEDKEPVFNSTEVVLSAECTPSASVALLHLASASQSSACCCSPVRREEALSSKSVARGKQKSYSARPAAGRKLGREGDLFSSPCSAAVAAPPAASIEVPCWQESKLKVTRIFKHSPTVDAATYVGQGCYLSASCISSSPYKREEENMRTPSTSSDGVLQVSPSFLREGAGVGLTSSSELGTNDVQARNLCHAGKSRETK